MDAVIQQQISAVPQNSHGILSACNQGIQIVRGIICHGENPALHIQYDETAVLSQFQRVC